MTPTKAIRHARTLVSAPMRVGNSWEVHSWSEPHGAWYMHQNIPTYPQAQNKARDERVRHALRLLDIPTSLAWNADGRAEDVVRDCVKAWNIMSAADRQHAREMS